jgi:hypothetical protein
VGEGVQVGVIVKVGVKLGRAVKVADGEGVKAIVGGINKEGAVSVDTGGKGASPTGKLQPNKRQLRPIVNNNLRLERISLYLAGPLTFILVIQLQNIRRTRAPADARPKRRGPMLQSIQ